MDMVNCRLEGVVAARCTHTIGAEVAIGCHQLALLAQRATETRRDHVIVIGLKGITCAGFAFAIG
jgi:hypothetical protein